MNENKSRSTAEQDSEKTALELYKTAFARLNFQDEYLFKFSTVFLTAHGALAVLAGSAVFRADSPNYSALTIISVIGLFLALVWLLWTHHNDFWHSVWTGTLRKIEREYLNTEARVFDAEHSEIAKEGKRSNRFLPTGHWIAKLIPLGVAAAWSLSLYVALSSCK
jgi:hypothetical protein